MTKILFFLNSTVRGGVEEHVLCILQGINRDKFDPVLVCPGELLKLIKPEIMQAGIRVHTVKIRAWTDFEDIKRFKRILKDEAPDVVHTHLFFATLFAAPLSKWAKVPKVVETAHIREAWRKGIKRCFWIDRFYYRYVDRIIAVSHAVKKFLVAEKGLKADKVEVVHNGVDLSRFTVDSGQLTLELTTQRVRFGVIGRLEPQKGHTYFLKAISLLDETLLRQAEFIIIGEGSLRAGLEEQTRESGVSKNVQFLGYRSDIQDIMKSLDVIVLPSLFEGLPLVLLEAGAMGKAVIATAVDGSPEVVEEGKTGFIVPDKNPESLQEAMEKFINNRALVAEFGQNGKERILQHFDLKDQIQKTEKLYERLLVG